MLMGSVMKQSLGCIFIVCLSTSCSSSSKSNGAGGGLSPLRPKPNAVAGVKAPMSSTMNPVAGAVAGGSVSVPAGQPDA